MQEVHSLSVKNLKNYLKNPPTFLKKFECLKIYKSVDFTDIFLNTHEFLNVFQRLVDLFEIFFEKLVKY